MTKYELPPLRPELVVCPKCGAGPNGRMGVHSHQKRRYKCHGCGKTFSDTHGTPLYGLKHPLWLVIAVLTLLAFGCPIPAIVAAFGLDERTVSDWQGKAGAHAQQVHAEVVCNGQVDVGQVQSDEFYVKTQCGSVWIASAMSVFSRLFLGAAVSIDRNTQLVTQVVDQVKAAAQPQRPILWAVDGFSAWVRAVLLRLRTPQRTGRRGRPRLLVWPALHIVQVVKRYAGRRLAAVDRCVVHGSRQAAQVLLCTTQGELGRFNTG